MHSPGEAYLLCAGQTSPGLLSQFVLRLWTPVCGLSTTLWPPSGWGCLLLTDRSYPLPQYEHVWVLWACCLVKKPTPEFPIFGSDRISAVCCLLVIAAQWFWAVRSLCSLSSQLCAQQQRNRHGGNIYTIGVRKSELCFCFLTFFISTSWVFAEFLVNVWELLTSGQPAVAWGSNTTWCSLLWLPWAVFMCASVYKLFKVL